MLPLNNIRLIWGNVKLYVNVSRDLFLNNLVQCFSKNTKSFVLPCNFLMQTPVLYPNK